MGLPSVFYLVHPTKSGGFINLCMVYDKLLVSGLQNCLRNEVSMVLSSLTQAIPCLCIIMGRFLWVVNKHG